MTIAVVGGTGFIGVELAKRLHAHDQDVAAIARGREAVRLPKDVAFVEADRMDAARMAAVLDDIRPSAVIDIFTISLRNTQSVLDAVGRIGGRYVMVSSTDVYANYGGLLKMEAPPVRSEPATEDLPLRSLRYPYRGNPRRPKGVKDDLFEDYDKLPIEEAVRADNRFETTIVRPPMIFGENDKQNRFGWVIDNTERGKPLTIDRRAAGWLNSYSYVADVAESLALAAVHPAAAGRTYNVAQPKDRTVKQWAETIIDIMGLECEVITVEPEANGIMADRAQSSDLRYPLTLDSRRIRDELGFVETLPESEALRRTIAWARPKP
ncbi:NAD-dependent epimerase/dehydratase family protein [Devosia rhodophyticola]|uniref:NAD-dependent epimerase/dehydratase family protein n=1 Tax=Devosia rhodophyticola TaxID=3026423 RepID=A0ABY7YXA7_9HYPH|nr:NAD-dependent epimerase/dehydratase family protein [Devosia rhodophyticola]WDR05881.1 NAD-dependent epimerase/dehydratase family protein [Devosia rhodophyticola]